ncbi:hypothetical protein [Streptomyces sp. NPDC093089]|uniref:hypothetical protein n=1 Tax=Streptomyces sp. NPDC093089 TaxID=3366024 RepID=UPI003822D554
MSAPVAWDEVERCADAAPAPGRLVLLMDDIAPRLERYGELLAPLFSSERAGAVP